MAPSTLATYRSAARKFFEWMHTQHNTEISTKTFLAYLEYLYDEGYGYDMANKFRSWVSWFSTTRLDSKELVESEKFKKALQGFKQLTKSYVKVTKPLKISQLLLYLGSPMLRGLSKDIQNIIRASLALAYTFFLRHGELVDIHNGISSIAKLPAGWKLHLSRSKSDTFSLGVTVVMPFSAIPQELLPWLDLFRPNPGKYPETNFNNTLRIFFDDSQIRFHSLRHGRASDLHDAGVSNANIMEWGRWKSQAAFQRYTGHM